MEERNWLIHLTYKEAFRSNLVTLFWWWQSLGESRPLIGTETGLYSVDLFARQITASSCLQLPVNTLSLPTTVNISILTAVQRTQRRAFRWQHCCISLQIFLFVRTFVMWVLEDYKYIYTHLYKRAVSYFSFVRVFSLKFIYAFHLICTIAGFLRQNIVWQWKPLVHSSVQVLPTLPVCIESENSLTHTLSIQPTANTHTDSLLLLLLRFD